jgi:hypothetical protein
LTTDILVADLSSKELKPGVKAGMPNRGYSNITFRVTEIKYFLVMFRRAENETRAL